MFATFIRYKHFIMDIVQITGLAAAALTTVSNLPQAYKIIKTKETKAVSVWSNLVLLGGLIIWVVYGFMRDDWPVIIANSIPSLITATVLFLKLSSKQTLENIHQKVN